MTQTIGGDGTRPATFSILSIANILEVAGQPVGIVLLDTEQDRLLCKISFSHRDTSNLDFLDVAIIEDLAGEVERWSLEAGSGETIFSMLENSLANVLRIGDRQAVRIHGSPEEALSRLFYECIVVKPA